MIARIQLAVIDHNSKVKRQQTQVKWGENKGAKRYNVSPKGKKKWFAKPIMEEKSYSCARTDERNSCKQGQWQENTINSACNYPQEHCIISSTK